MKWELRLYTDDGKVAAAEIKIDYEAINRLLPHRHDELMSRFLLQVDFCDRDFGQESKEVRCRFCHERDLWWREEPGGLWVLTNGEGKPHVCVSRGVPNSLSIDDFKPE